MSISTTGFGDIKKLVNGISRNDGASVVEGANKVLNDILETANLTINSKAGPKVPGGGETDDRPALAPPDEEMVPTTSLGKGSMRETLGNLLEKIVANAKLETDQVMVEQTENRIETEKNTLEGAANRQRDKVEKNLEAMAKAAKNQTIMKALAWVMAGVAAVVAVVTAGVGIAAMVAAGAAAAGTGAAAGGTAAAAAAMSAATEAAATGAAAGGAAGAAAGGTIVDAAALAGGSIAVDGVMVTTTSGGGFTLSLASTAATETTVVAETVTTTAAEATAAAMNSVATVKGITFTLVSGAAGIGMQIADETGVLEEAKKSLADKLRKNGMKSSDADLAASLIIGVSQMVAVAAPGIAGGSLAGRLMKVFEVGAVAQGVTVAGMTGFSLAMTMPQQGLTIESQYKAGMAGADVEEQQAMIQLINQMIEETQEELQDVLEKLQNSMGKIGDVILSALDAQKEIADNMAKVV